jgi:hypothetical protein
MDESRSNDHPGGGPWPEPPLPPKTTADLAQEMLGCIFNNLDSYQGALHYWLMWRLPQLISLTRGTPGLKFHYCAATPHDLYRDFLRLFLLPDLLLIGQCGPLLVPERLFFLHDYDKTWPNVDGNRNALAAIAGKEDRPIPDELVAFFRFFFAPLAPTGRLLYAPLATMLSDHTPDLTPLEETGYHLEQMANRSKAEGLPFGGFSMKERTIAAAEQLRQPNAPESASLSRPGDPPSPDWKNLHYQNGRLVAPDALFPMVDPRWSPAEILGFEFYVSRCLDAMLLVGGRWANTLPFASHHLNVRMPYVEGIPPEALTAAIADDPSSFRTFRKTISHALSQAFASVGSENFEKEVARIQNEIIDDGIDLLNRQWRDLTKIRLARFGVYSTAAVMLEVGLYTGKSLAEVAALLAIGAAGSVFAEIKDRTAEAGNLRNEPMFFIWRIRNKVRK